MNSNTDTKLVKRDTKLWCQKWDSSTFVQKQWVMLSLSLRLFFTLQSDGLYDLRVICASVILNFYFKSTLIIIKPLWIALRHHPHVDKLVLQSQANSHQDLLRICLLFIELTYHISKRFEGRGADGDLISCMDILPVV